MTPLELQALASRFRSLEEVMRWSFAEGLPLVDVVTQDEYTHDVVLGAAPHWLVFDTT
jgi:hypothetical protein